MLLCQHSVNASSPWHVQVRVRLAGHSNGVLEGSTVTVECQVTSRPREVQLVWRVGGEVREGGSLLVSHQT